LWLSSGTGNGGLWRIPLDAAGGLVAAPQLFPLDEPPVALLGGDASLWVLAADGTVVRASVT
jgi:hypothetical protein